MPVQFAHNNAIVNGFRMHYVTAGPSEGYPLVLIHGWPQSWFQWRKVVPALVDAGYYIVAPDLRGLGDSDKPLTGYDKRTAATDVKALLDHLGLEKVGVLSHDWGGAVAYFLAADNRSLVERLMVLDTGPGVIREGDSFPIEGALMLSHVIFQAGKPDWAERIISHDIEGYIKQFLGSMVWGSPSEVFADGGYEEYVRVNSIPGAIRAGMQWYAECLRKDPKDLASITEKLQIPVEVYGGEKFLGDLTPLWSRVAENVAGSSVPECGHYIAEEKPDFVIERSLAFFDGLAK